MMISDTIKYIGVDDLDIDLFESQYVVPEGMSYNSYLIDDEKIAVMDTADRRKGEEWKTNLKARSRCTYCRDARDLSRPSARLQCPGCENAA